MLLDDVLNLEDVLIGWKASNSGQVNGVRLNSGNVVDVYRCNYNETEFPDNPDLTRYDLDLNNTEHLDLMAHLHDMIINDNKFVIADPVCDVFKSNELILLSTSDVSDNLTNYVDLTRLHYVNRTYPCYWKEKQKVVSCFLANKRLVLYVGDANPDKCRVGISFILTDKDCVAFIIGVNDFGSPNRVARLVDMEGEIRTNMTYIIMIIDGLIREQSYKDGFFIEFCNNSSKYKVELDSKCDKSPNIKYMRLG